MNSAQETLFPVPFVPAPPTYGERFQAFHEAHPEVYWELARLARQRLARFPGSRIGMKHLWEVARWSLGLVNGEDYRLNNNYTALYSRLLMEREPDLTGVFETRKRRTE